MIVDGQSHCEQYLSQCRSNTIPLSTLQVAQLKASIHSARAALEACGDDQTHSRHELARILEFQNSLLAPIRKIPPEILSYIFMFVATPIYCTRPNYYTSPKLQSLVFRLTWTCSWWRCHVVAEPALWSSFKIDCDVPFRSYTADQRAFVRECVARSGDHTSLHWNFRNVRNIRSWSYLLRHAKRLETLHCESWNLQMLHDELRRLFKRLHKKASEDSAEIFFPRLEHLSLAIPGVSDMQSLANIGPMDDLFAKCPSLHTLSINLLRETDPIDLSHLTDLRIGSYYMGRSFSALLSKCPMLQTFTVDRFVADPDLFSRSSSYIPPLMHHTNLTALKITWFDRHCVPGFWKCVRLPNLTFLRVSVKGFRTSGDGELQGLLRELREMVLTSQSMPSDTLESFLKELNVYGLDV
ncbi:hypothetical protein D9757_011480 [Collybiopsis confluens]|uniref:F-box domain-containing protein n=1 Tax=Collybiopsis confluens TaxID=2823264 RepID=A0A8H5GVW5_9AGAR|nr:hypothetical protein D9757_011480 [Collybiopsis confluens]